MSTPKPPSLAKLVIGFILSEKKLGNEIITELVEKHGPLDVASRWLDFDYTHYYEKEMGRPLYRRVLVFKKLIEQSDLADIKIATNEVEKRYAVKNNRRVNIDPGYLLLERFVLATGKNFPHRIYLDKGIYADLTLIYVKGKYQTLPWTYPDYAADDMKKFLETIRDKYKIDLKLMETRHTPENKRNGRIT